MTVAGRALRWALRALVLAVLSTGPALAQDDPLRPGIIGADDRTILLEEGRFDAVGRLNIAGSSFCTATLIAPEWVVTAAHCLFFRRTGRLARPDRVHFLAGFRKGDYVAHRRAVEIIVHPGYAGLLNSSVGPVDPTEIASDVALIRLEAPISPDDATPISIAPPPRPGARLTAVSYARDRSQLPSIERNCVVIWTEVSAVVSTCDSNFGGSGGPLFVVTEEGFGVAAVMSGFGEFRSIRVSFASAGLAELSDGAID